MAKSIWELCVYRGLRTVFLFSSLIFLHFKWHRNYVTLYSIQFKLFDEPEMKITSDKRKQNKYTQWHMNRVFGIETIECFDTLSLVLQWWSIITNIKLTIATNLSTLFFFFFQRKIKYWSMEMMILKVVWKNSLVYNNIFLSLDSLHIRFKCVIMYFRLLVQSSILRARALAYVRLQTLSIINGGWSEVKWKVFSLLAGVSVCKCLNCLCVCHAYKYTNEYSEWICFIRSSYSSVCVCVFFILWWTWNSKLLYLSIDLDALFLLVVKILYCSDLYALQNTNFFQIELCKWMMMMMKILKKHLKSNNTPITSKMQKLLFIPPRK